jgi:PAS domain-containing protein
MGDGWADGVHPEDLPDCLRDFLKSFHARQPLRLEYRFRRHDGEYRWIVDEGRPFYEQDGTFAVYIGACFDVAERKIAEEALRKSERRFAAIMDNMPGFAWIKDAEGRYFEALCHTNLWMRNKTVVPAGAANCAKSFVTRKGV